VVKPSDSELVARIADGDDDALTPLMERHAPPLMRYATHFLRSADDADDVLQDVFLRARRAFRHGTRPEDLPGWLFRVTVNRCRSRHRRWWPFVRGEAGHDHVVAPGESEAVRFEWREEIERALATLSPPLREAFLLKHVEGMDYDAMARTTGSGIAALKMRVARARQQLRQQLEGVR
jgi:RNA polymerase sigma-70 factor, ECF subfamily